MMLKPNHVWKWYFDTKTDALMLDLGQDMGFHVAISTKDLIPDAFENNAFTVDDASLFQNYLEAIAQLSVSSTTKTQLALNAVAAFRFHKPVLPKSWFFYTQKIQYSPSTGCIVSLENAINRGAFLVIENMGCASLCMFVDEGVFKLNESKEMHFCDVIKVMNDRLLIVDQENIARDDNDFFALLVG